MTSQGQRFRRRALRRGYKVDEVDAFLDRVEATLSGDPIGAAVAAQEVHDVVFRVRFGGYDEWQVDLHLDRVERQLADLEERSGGFDRRPTSDRLSALRDDMPLEPRRPPVPAPPMPSRPLAPVGGYGMNPPMSGPPLAPPPMSAPPMRPMSAPPMRPMSAPPGGGYGGGGGFGGGGFNGPNNPPPGFGPSGGHPQYPGGMGNGHPRFEQREYTPNGFGPGGPGPGGGDFGGRRGRMDMTHEMRLDLSGAMPISGGPASPQELQRIDSMRRTFTARRFGSGYDAIQVNRLFDAIIAALSGRSGMPLNESELDPNQFSLVPGGYFEAEVNQALREVRELVRR